ncbi:unnamed protein product [Protopolystoma xenopodis]|uniref:Uncharacterized protein n=1 Tax=Protopolystoma xenopodis TaxID=117903 RepID=A0A3S5FCS5_9PLAT|nr:unnamed protein product [Protopolystoma xenopodis]
MKLRPLAIKVCDYALDFALAFASCRRQDWAITAPADTLGLKRAVFLSSAPITVRSETSELFARCMHP